VDRSPGSVLVIGGGAAGCAAALELSRRGIPALVVEAADRLGGLAEVHGCKSTSRCERCDACLPRDVRRKVLAEGTVRVMTSSRVTDVSREGDDLVVTVAGPHGVARERFGAIVVAIGPMAFDPSLDPRLGYGMVTDVLSSVEVDRAVRSGRLMVPSTGRRPSSLAIVQCVGSRDDRHGAPYCSKACCKYAYRLARHLQHSDPDLQVTMFYLDWRPLDGDLEALVRWEREGGRAIRARPAEIVERDGRPVVRYAGPGDEPIEESFDLVMLTVGLLPPRDGPELSSMLEVPLDEQGFFPQEHGRVLAAGCCAGPKDIDESVKEGIAAAGRAASLVVGT